jgi:FixJ family two-component response regulator
MTEQKIVYILDDDPDIGNALEHLLKVHGYRACLFVSIADFNARAKPQEAVCLVLDIQLNGAGFRCETTAFGVRP